jgi:hypothetical protein
MVDARVGVLKQRTYHVEKVKTLEQTSDVETPRNFLCFMPMQQITADNAIIARSTIASAPGFFLRFKCWVHIAGCVVRIY